MTALSFTIGQIHGVVVDFFFPCRCVECGTAGDFLCLKCRQQLPRILPPFCRRCGKPETSGDFCSSCWGAHTAIDGIRSPFHYDGVIRRAILELKYHNLKAISACLAELLAAYIQSTSVPGEVIAPVPLHPRRMRKRGYNQSGLLAHQLGKLTALPVVDDCLARFKDSLPQARTTTADARRKNVADAFACRNRKFDGKHVILVDDVCTSGATLEACAVALKSGGAASVWGLTLARETKGGDK